jgi:predicted nicotinamide N-methyase
MPLGAPPQGSSYRRESVVPRPAPAGDEVIEETVSLGSWPVALLRPRDAHALLDERAFEHEEYLPYWADLWPSARVLARAVARRTLRGARVLELGCGLGVVSIAAAAAGGRVLATDWAPDALAFTRENAARNGVRVETLRCDWARPEPVTERAPWDLVLASDVLYERRTVELLLALLPRLVRPRGEVWIADPGRPTADLFLEGAAPAWDRRCSVEEGPPRVRLHRLRLRAPAG